MSNSPLYTAWREAVKARQDFHWAHVDNWNSEVGFTYFELLKKAQRLYNEYRASLLA